MKPRIAALAVVLCASCGQDRQREDGGTDGPPPDAGADRATGECGCYTAEAEGEPVCCPSNEVCCRTESDCPPPAEICEPGQEYFIGCQEWDWCSSAACDCSWCCWTP